ncbi:MAG TPA: helix-turn-helix transcriptional regulator [Thermoanaerobaculia bacterium]|nr:helix-turn-helix transcriptional regulator [Thermoanaerobaculia bacterium]
MLHIQIRDARMKAGISRAELARRAGISRALLVKFEETGAKCWRSHRSVDFWIDWR